jgi:hypothetical protein
VCEFFQPTEKEMSAVETPLAVESIASGEEAEAEEAEEETRAEMFILSVVTMLRKMVKSDSGLKVTLEADGYKGTFAYEETYLERLQQCLRQHEEGVKRMSKQIQTEEARLGLSKSSSCAATTSKT